MVYFTVITVVVGNVVPSTAFYSIPYPLHLVQDGWLANKALPT